MQSPIDVGVTLSRIRYAKFVMEAAKNLNMIYWQNDKYDTDTKVNVNCSSSIGELHRCGNTACFAGYLAISPLWKMIKGTTRINGEPKWGKYIPEGTEFVKYYVTDSTGNKNTYEISMDNLIDDFKYYGLE